MRVDREGKIQHCLDQTDYDHKEISLDNVIDIGRVGAEAERGDEVVHPVPDGHVPEEDPEEHLKCSVKKLVQYAKLHLLSVVGLRVLEFFFREKFCNIVVGLLHFIATQLLHVNNDFESSSDSKCDQEVEEVREGRLVFFCDFVDGPVARRVVFIAGRQISRQILISCGH